MEHLLNSLIILKKVKNLIPNLRLKTFGSIYPYM